MESSRWLTVSADPNSKIRNYEFTIQSESCAVGYLSLSVGPFHLFQPPFRHLRCALCDATPPLPCDPSFPPTIRDEKHDPTAILPPVSASEKFESISDVSSDGSRLFFGYFISNFFFFVSSRFFFLFFFF